MKIKWAAWDLPMFNKFFPYLKNASEQAPFEFFSEIVFLNYQELIISVLFQYLGFYRKI